MVGYSRWDSIALLACAMCLGSQPAAGQTTVASEPTQRHVLFIGNSYTYYNNLPAMVEALAVANGCPLRTARVTIPGGALGEHWAAGIAVDSIRAHRWANVVLQEQSLLGGIHLDGEPVIGAPDTFRAYAARFGREINDAGSSVLLLQTWARKSKPDDQAALDHAYFSVGRSLGAAVAPVGIAWAEVLRQKSDDIELHASDGSHPSASGTFLAAAVLVRMLCPRMMALRAPEAITYDSIDGVGRVVGGEQVQLALPSGLEQRLVQAAAQAVDSIRAAGGYLLTAPVPPPPLPSLPPGRAPKAGALVGRWRGDIALNIPGIIQFDITGNTPSLVSGSVEVRLGRSDYRLDVPRLPLENGRFSFDVPLGQHGYFRFEGVDTGNTIAGVGRIILNERVRAIGRTRLLRDGGSGGGR